MVLLGRIELPTSALPRMRSTTELQQHTISCDRPIQRVAPLGQARPLAVGGGFVKRGLHWRVPFVTAGAMTTREPPSPATGKADRQARLAEQLRANLRRRKAQARAIDAAAPPKTDLPKP